MYCSAISNRRPFKTIRKKSYATFLFTANLASSLFNRSFCRAAATATTGSAANTDDPDASNPMATTSFFMVVSFSLSRYSSALIEGLALLPIPAAARRLDFQHISRPGLHAGFRGNAFAVECIDSASSVSWRDSSPVRNQCHFSFGKKTERAHDSVAAAVRSRSTGASPHLIAFDAHRILMLEGLDGRIPTI